MKAPAFVKALMQKPSSPPAPALSQHELSATVLGGLAEIRKAVSSPRLAVFDAGGNPIGSVSVVEDSHWRDVAKALQATAAPSTARPFDAPAPVTGQREAIKTAAGGRTGKQISIDPKPYLKGVKVGAEVNPAVAQAYAQAGFDAGMAEGIVATANSFVLLLDKELPRDQAVALLKKGAASPDPLVSIQILNLVRAHLAAAKP
jgi:hypothetical protein